MNFETLKSIMLLILICFSLLLTVGLWNYQPSLDEREKGSLVEETTIGGKEAQISSLIAPSQFVFHKNGEHYSFKNGKDREDTYEVMKNWTLFNVQPIDNSGVPEEGRMMEVIFPTNIPAQTIKNLFNFGDQNFTPPVGEFKRIFFTFNDNGGVDVFFKPELEDATAFRASLRSENIYKLEELLAADEGLREQTMFTGNGEKRIFLPETPVEVHSHIMDTTTLPITPLKNTLFEDPSIVRNFPAPRAEQRLTDGLGNLEVTEGWKRMIFTELLLGESSSQVAMSSFEVLERSISFINAHQGWTDTFRIGDLSASNTSVTYQMYQKDLPVLASDDDIHTIEVNYQNGEEQRYARPLVRLEPSINESKGNHELPSGKKVIAVIQESRLYNIKLIEDIKIGYKLVEQSGGYGGYSLIPAWFVLENGSWKEITGLTEDKGGLSSAVGSN
ncbi:two-component system activity regulator YycH [Halobacillus shinanisalinarum]|uniref:Two-component system activity regulator YycH n=1 Tax=Halobacillus shinanisalinarum TaxID=2932258 RepID=A0ABY4H5J7_9BACI|nr:two-component system activity regulator YycH [Halobacillus shinanisalinarum]UOQ95481.1 two-component system activity regulator YycH [Halobacillus shinanisalinarum]